jgi:hypothetical protein
LPFAYSPYRLDIDAATHLTAANEGIDFTKLTVKKNRYFRPTFFAWEDTRMHAQDDFLRLSYENLCLRERHMTRDALFFHPSLRRSIVDAPARIVYFVVT